MENGKDDNIEELKRKLKGYTEQDFEFNEPHITERVLLRGGSKQEIINNLLYPKNLVYSYQEIGKYGDVKHNLCFNMNDKNTLIIPVIFDRNNKKSLHIITYIMRYRKWEHMVKRVG